MNLPWNDWQFWIVSLTALFAAAFLLRGVIPGRLWRGSRGGSKVSLTIKGAKPTQRAHPRNTAR